MVTIAEAAINFGVSQDTIRKWMIDLGREGSANGTHAMNEPRASESTAASTDEVNWWQTLVATLQSQVAGQQEQLSAKDLQLETKDRQIRELHPTDCPRILEVGCSGTKVRAKQISQLKTSRVCNDIERHPEPLCIIFWPAQPGADKVVDSRRPVA